MILRLFSFVALLVAFPALAAPRLSVCTITQLQRENLREFREQVIPQMVASRNPYHSLPAGIPEDLVPGFQKLLDLTRDGRRVFRYLQDAELEVVSHAEREGLSLSDALQRWMEMEEQRFGFAPAVHVHVFLTQEEIMAHFAAGRPLADYFWLDKPHSRDGHRLQSILEARHLELELGSTTLYLRLYRYMGDRRAMLQDLRWEGTGIDVSQINPAIEHSHPDLFGLLHDTPFFTWEPYNITPNDFTNPVFFAGLRRYLPGLIGWR